MGGRPIRDQSGESLVELIVSISILALFGIAVIGAIRSVGAVSGVQRTAVTARATLTSFAERLDASSFLPCATPAQYEDALSFSPPSGYQASIGQVTSWDGSAFGPGQRYSTLQKMDLTVTPPETAFDLKTGSGAVPVALTVVKRMDLLVEPLTATASGGVPVGSTVDDAACLTADPAAAGQITFRVYGPADPTCTYARATMTIPAAGGSGLYLSAPFTPPEPGTYRWIAEFSDGVSPTARTTGCGAVGQESLVTP